MCTMGVLLVAITVAAIAANAEGRERFACSTFEWGRVCRYRHLMTAANTAASQRMRVSQLSQKLERRGRKTSTPRELATDATTTAANACAWCASVDLRGATQSRR